MRVPRVRSCVAKALCEWVRLGVDVGENVRQPLVDKMCDNRYCMRRTDGGYEVCMPMDDPCYFCIRYGLAHLCANVYVPLLCRRCHDAAAAAAAGAEPSSSTPPERYPSVAPHYRSQRRMDPDENPREAATAQAARDQRHHRQGVIELSQASQLANRAVLAETHK